MDGQNLKIKRTLKYKPEITEYGMGLASCHLKCMCIGVLSKRVGRYADVIATQ